MALLTNSAEGYSTTGTTVTTGNSDGGSGAAFALVTATVGSSIQAINTDHAHGSWCYQVVETTAANNSIVGWTGLAASALADRFYIKFTTLPSAGAARLRVFAIRTASGNVVTLDVNNTNNRWLVGINNVNQATGWTGAVTTGQWYRVEVEAQTGATGTGDGYVAVRYYLLDSTTPVEAAYTNTAASTGTALFDNVRYGKLDASGYADLKFDDLALQTGSASPLGPFASGSATVSVPAATVTLAGASNDAVDAETAVTGGGPMAVAVGFNAPVVNSPGSGNVNAPTAKVTVAAKAATPAAVSTPGFSATADPDNAPPRVLLTVNAATGTQVTIRRVDQQGNAVTVRAANPAPLVSGGWIGYDYEAPFNQPVTYTATTDVQTASSLSTMVTLTVTQPWLIHPGIPDLSVPLEVANQPTKTRPSGRGLYTVLGRPDAVARSDGQRKSRSFDLQVRTYSAADEDALDDLIDDDSVLLLQITDPRIYRDMYAWVSIGDATQEPLATYREGFETWTLPCTEAARPSGLLQAQRTWADVVAGYATWRDVLDAYATWRDEITDTVS